MRLRGKVSKTRKVLRQQSNVHVHFPNVFITEFEKKHVLYVKTFTAWKVSVFGVFPVRIYSHSDCTSLCSVWMWENTDQKNSEYGHFSHSGLADCTFSNFFTNNYDLFSTPQNRIISQCHSRNLQKESQCWSSIWVSLEVTLVKAEFIIGAFPPKFLKC